MAVPGTVQRANDECLTGLRKLASDTTRGGDRNKVTAYEKALIEELASAIGVVDPVVRLREVLALVILECKRCGWKWWRRSPARAQLCPKCRARRWWENAGPSCPLQLPARRHIRRGFMADLPADLIVN